MEVRTRAQLQAQMEVLLGAMEALCGALPEELAESARRRLLALLPNRVAAARGSVDEAQVQVLSPLLVALRR